MEKDVISYWIGKAPMLFFGVMGVFFGVRYLFSKTHAPIYISKLFTYFSERLTIDKILESDLFLNEPLIRNDIDNLTFKNDQNTVKQTHAKILMVNKLESIVSNSKKLLAVDNLKNLEKRELLELIRNTTNAIILEYETKTKNDYIQLQKNKDITSSYAACKGGKMYNIVYNDNEYGFERIHNSNISLLRIFFKTIPLSKESNLSIISHLINLYHCAMISAMDDIKVSFELLNGRLSSECD